MDNQDTIIPDFAIAKSALPRNLKDFTGLIPVNLKKLTGAKGSLGKIRRGFFQLCEVIPAFCLHILVHSVSDDLQGTNAKSGIGKQRRDNGQSTIEFTFAMIVSLVLLFAMLMVFRWAGLDLAERRFAHDRLLSDNTLRSEQQLNPNFFKPRKIDASFRGFDLK